MSLPDTAVLAGGMATRLGELAKGTPKAMVQVAGRPFVDWQLERMAAQGVERVVLCVGHLADALRDHVGDGGRFGLSVAYSQDGERPLGTGGALKKALPLLSDPFFVLYADSWLEIDWDGMLDGLRRPGAEAVMSLLHNRGALQASNALFEAGWVKAYAKQAPGAGFEHIDYGLNLFTRRAFAHIAAEAFDLGTLQAALARAGTLAGHIVTTRFYEIGTPEGLAETQAHFEKG